MGGGCLEHPATTHAWDYFEIEHPQRSGGWTKPDRFGGSSCYVEQGHYGHRARKATYLYAVRCQLPQLIWGVSRPPTIARPRGGTQGTNCEVMGKQERLRTPLAFRDLLLGLAR